MSFSWSNFVSRSSLVRAGLLSLLVLGNAGCVKGLLIDSQIKSTRQASTASDTIADYEVARAAIQAGLIQFEALHTLRPNNEDALMLLTRNWASYGYAFCQDDMEAALVRGDEEAAEYHKKRAKHAYDRAIAYGTEFLGHYADGFEEARKRSATLKAWVDANFDEKEDAELLYWFGSAWLARVGLMKDEPEYVADLFVAVPFIERAVKLNESFNAYAGLTSLATYHARSSMAEMDEAQKLFESALAKTGRRSLFIQLGYAQRYACNKGDKALYEKLINEVLSAEDPEPKLRLQNTIAKRKAKRALNSAVMSECGFQ